MNRTFLIAFVAAFVAAIFAMLSSKSRESLTAADASAETGPLFPVLDERVNDVASVTVASADGSFTVKREGDAWGAADKGGYPIDFSKARGLVVGIAGFDVIQPMTANPEFHAKLGLAEPDAPESTSKRVTLEDADGTVLADVIVGEARVSQGRGGQPSLYARRAGEDQTYEVTGRLYVDTNESTWLDRKVLELKQERVSQVTITHPDGEVVHVFRNSKDDANYEVAELPEGRELVWEGVARSIATAAQNLTLEDVGKDDLFDFAAVETTTAEFRTFDGLIVTATTAQADDKTYLKVTARAEEVVPPVGPLPAAPDEAADDEASAEGEGTEGIDSAAGEVAAAEEPADEGPTFEEVQAEADEINARVGGWTYVVPGWSATNLRKRTEELLEPLPEEEAAAEPGSEDAADTPLLDQDGEELPEDLQKAIQEALEGNAQDEPTGG